MHDRLAGRTPSAYFIHNFHAVITSKDSGTQTSSILLQMLALIVRHPSKGNAVSRTDTKHWRLTFPCLEDRQPSDRGAGEGPQAPSRAERIWAVWPNTDETAG